MGYYYTPHLVRYRIRCEIGYNAMLSACKCVCVSVENRLEREITYSADIFQSQVPRTKRYPVYKQPRSTVVPLRVSHNFAPFSPL